MKLGYLSIRPIDSHCLTLTLTLTLLISHCHHSLLYIAVVATAPINHYTAIAPTPATGIYLLPGTIYLVNHLLSFALLSWYI